MVRHAGTAQNGGTEAEAEREERTGRGPPSHREPGHSGAHAGGRRDEGDWAHTSTNNLWPGHGDFAGSCMNRPATIPRCGSVLVGRDANARWDVGPPKPEESHTCRMRLLRRNARNVVTPEVSKLRLCARERRRDPPALGWDLDFNRPWRGRGRIWILNVSTCQAALHLETGGDVRLFNKPAS